MSNCAFQVRPDLLRAPGLRVAFGPLAEQIHLAFRLAVYAAKSSNRRFTKSTTLSNDSASQTQNEKAQ